MKTGKLGESLWLSVSLDHTEEDENVFKMFLNLNGLVLYHWVLQLAILQTNVLKNIITNAQNKNTALGMFLKFWLISASTFL